jgi:hypothetical protein
MIIGNSFKNLTNIGRIRKNFLNKNVGIELYKPDLRAKMEKDLD